MKMRGMRMSVQIGVAFLLILVSYGALLVGSIMINRSVRSSYERLFNKKDTQTNLANTINSELKDAQREQREFFLTKDMSSVDKVVQNCQAMSVWAEVIRDQVGETIKGSGENTGEVLLSAVESYKQAFLQAVEAWQAKGLNADAGLQGEFRDAARELENRVSGYPNLMGDYLLQQQHEKDYLLYGGQQYVEGVEAQVARIRGGLSGTSRSASTVAALSGLLDRYGSAFQALVARDAEIAEASEQMEAAVIRIRLSVDSVLNKTRADMFETKQSVDASLQRASFIFAGGGVAVLVIAGLVFLIIARNILRRVGGEPALIASVVEQVAEGDLSVELSSGRKKDTGIVMAVRTMVGKLNSLLHEVMQSAEEVASSSEALSANARQLAQGAQNQASTLEETAASVEELIASVEQVAQHAQSQTASVEENMSSVEEVNRAATEVSNNLNSVMTAISNISESSSKITRILNIISEIASQTNLLALNASIEAARAGEHGRGFAVVADEVSKLAERSSTSAKEIVGLIRESERNVSAGNEMIDKLAMAIQTQIEGIREVAQALEDISEMSQNISAATEEQSTNAREVSKAIENVNELTQTAAGASEQMSVATEELSGLAQVMQRLVEQFRLKEEGEVEGREVPRIEVLSQEGEGSDPEEDAFHTAEEQPAVQEELEEPLETQDS
jgi:methyl-accepting chemotaxis protein